MSKISDIYDALAAKVVATLPSHKELNNPYFLEEDAKLSYDAAYGVTFSVGSNVSDNPRSGNEQRERIFDVTLTRRKFSTKRDSETRKTTERTLMDDWTLMVNAISSDPNLGNPSLLNEILYSSDTGISFLEMDVKQNNILYITTSFTVRTDEVVSAPC